MQVELKYTVGSKVWVQVDGGWWEGTVQVCAYRLDSDGNEARTYSGRAQRVTEDEKTKKRITLYRDFISSENDLVNTQLDYLKWSGDLSTETTEVEKTVAKITLVKNQ